MAHLKIYHNENIYFTSGYKNQRTKLKSIRPEWEDRFSNKIKKVINPTKQEIIIILFSGCTQTNEKDIIKFIRKNSIEKIYFFIEDVLRLYSNTTYFNMLETYPIETIPDEVHSYELDIISRILSKTKCKYKIYHCEKDSFIIAKNYNLKIDYFDYYFTSIASTMYTKDYVANDNNRYIFDKKISCFNLRFEYHRYIIGLLIKDFDTVLSLNNLCTTKKLLNNKTLPLANFSPQTKEKILTSHYELKNTPILWDAENSDIVDIESDKQKNTIQGVSKAFVDVVTETRYASNMINLTEKTIKPIVAHRPFIMVGPVGTISHLQSLGFRTFNKWWDESYDNETNHNKRLEMIYKIINDINNIPIDNLKIMLQEMHSVLEHNYKTLRKQFKKNKKYLVT
jgi:hypothetical protein|tara:strand:+ start:4300 stop:5487 length:1188 start_codon:yes stop_codon:yes gene_type:complete